MRVAPDGITVLTSRNNRDTFTREFGGLTTVLSPVLGAKAVVLDGEIVAYDEHGRIDFALLQEARGHRPGPGRQRGAPIAGCHALPQADGSLLVLQGETVPAP
jgi:bifunctional non-homologous end joining protein LigD